ncbi:MAG: alginate lyase family protein [Candidatus Azobacteroides sp.]|nr:alginate lyase family protein [Candidatus Azobacteroides sp.]
MKHVNLTLLFSCVFFVLLHTETKSQTIDDMFPNLVLSRADYIKWKTAIDSEDASVGKDAYNNYVRLLAAKIIRDNVSPSPVTSLSENGATAKVEADMARMYTLSLSYLLTENQEHLNKAKEFYLAWAEINSAAAENSPAETAYTPGIEGYSIIRKCIDETSRQKIDTWIRRRADRALADRVRKNNWETIRLQFILHYGLVLEDESLINTFKVGYDAHIPNNLYPNGTSEDLLGRDAFSYHGYNMLFYARILKALALYYGNDYAETEYKREHRWGASIWKSVEFWKPYILYPDKYPHTEFVETEWAPDKNGSSYNKPYNPSGTTYVVDELYYTDQSLLECIAKYRSNTQTATLPLWLSSLRWE